MPAADRRSPGRVSAPLTPNPPARVFLRATALRLRLAAFVGRLRGHELLTLAYIAFLLLLETFSTRQVSRYAGYGAMLVFMTGSITFSSRNALTALVRNLSPAVLLVPIYASSVRYVPLYVPYDIDAGLIAIDAALFGVHPTVWLSQFASPLLTEVMQICYAMFYLLPLAIGLALLRRGKQAEYETAAFMITYGLFLSYLGYFPTPAVGPRFTLHDIELLNQELPMPDFGLGLRALIASTSGRVHDCFPSGHTDITLCLLLLAWRYHRKLFWLLLPVGVTLISATVYLRYHYAIDLVAGFFFFLFTALTAGRVQSAIHHRLSAFSLWLRSAESLSAESPSVESAPADASRSKESTPLINSAASTLSTASAPSTA